MHRRRTSIVNLLAALCSCCAVTSAQLPAGWSSQDIGSPGLSGSASESSGTWTVSGGGADIWNASDQFHYVSRTLPGDGTIVARVDAVGTSNNWAKTGVMIRGGAETNAAFAGVVVTPSNSVHFQWRSSAGESAQTLSAGGIVTAPVWVRLTRSGEALSGSFSYDGWNWVQIGEPEPVALDATALAGLAVCAANNSDLSTAAFSRVSVLPAGWESVDIGGPSIAGATTFDGEQMTVAGSGLIGLSSSDQFHFAGQRFVGDVAVVAKVDGFVGGGTFAKVGVMIRDGSAANARYAFSFIYPNVGNANFEYRDVASTAADTEASTSGISPPLWVKLVRRGSTFTSYRSVDGMTWIQNGSPVEIEMGGTTRVGIAVASGGGILATATLSNVRVLPPDWSPVEIGEPAFSGTDRSDGLAWRVNGGGADIWGTADQFHFTRRYFTGDMVIVAKVRSLLNTSTWAKAGLMIRESAGADSSHAAVYIRPTDSTFEYRDGAGSTTQSGGSSGGAVAPRWLKLERVDDVFTAYQSSNGMDWVQIGSASVAMNPTVQVGLAVCANNDATLNSAVFSDVFVGTYYRSPFLHTDDVHFRNHHGAGDAVALRGSNIGGWMLHEEWINGMQDGAALDDITVRNTLESRFGRAMANRIIAQFEDHWFTETDLDHLRELGLNVLRVPFSYRCLIDADGNWRSDAFTQLDWVVDEAWKRGIYTILDLHGAPGGASPFYSSGTLGGGALWTDPALQDMSVELWARIAEHYAGHPGLVAYDLINEPVPPSETALNSLYDEMYDAIRAVDPEHVVIMGAGGGDGVGGYYWSINTLPAPSTYGWSNVAYQSHSYATAGGSAAESEAQWQIWQHEAHPHVPMLVGEFNLSNRTSYAVQLWDDNDLHWTSWTYKVRYGNEDLHWGIYAGNEWPWKPDLQNDTAEEILTIYAVAPLTEGNYSLDLTNRIIFGTPLLMDDVYTTPPGEDLYVPPEQGVLANDMIPNAGLTNIEAHAYQVDGPWHGTLSALWEDGSFYYTPDAGFTGTDGFRYFVWDNVNDSANIATASIIVEELPTLSVAIENGSQVSVSWPEWAEGFGCRLYTSTNLVSPGVWETATNTASIQSNSFVVTLPEPEHYRFYRLMQP